MSKIRLHGSSSGYTEIAPVAASGNNTLTLPNDGTIISQDSNGAVGVTSITVGTGVTIGDGKITCDGSALTSINAAQLVGVCTSGLTKTGGFGKILQVVGNSTGTEVSTTSQSFTDTGLTCDITPTAAGSKILVLVDQIFQLSASTFNTGTSIQLLEDSTVIVASQTNDIYYYAGNNAHDTQNNKTRYTLNILRTASYSLGDTLTYKTQFKSLSDAAVTTSKAQCNNGASHITLVEVSG